METIDSLYNNIIKLIQAKAGYRFSLDPVLLADFVTLRGKERILDLGSGCGVLPLLLARRSPDLALVGWELQQQMVERACRSVELSGLSAQVSILHADLRHFREIAEPGSFDLVVTNPPYRSPGRGRISPGDERAAARHELAGGLADFLMAGSWCLNNGGRFAIVYLAERLSELLTGMVKVGIEPKRLRMVHPRQGEPASMVLVEGRKSSAPELLVEPPLCIYKGNESARDYTDEVLQIYGEKS